MNTPFRQVERLHRPPSGPPWDSVNDQRLVGGTDSRTLGDGREGLPSDDDCGRRDRLRAGVDDVVTGADDPFGAAAGEIECGFEGTRLGRVSRKISCESCKISCESCGDP